MIHVFDTVFEFVSPGKSKYSETCWDLAGPALSYPLFCDRCCRVRISELRFYG